MDTSLKYVEMCREYVIQINWKFELGDYFGYHADVTWEDKSRTHGVDIMDEPLLNSKERYTHWIWLPRQDQLQDMIDETWTSVDLAWHFSEWATKATSEWGNTTSFRSMEQLWLAYVMEKEHSERWSGSTWEAV